MTSKDQQFSQSGFLYQSVKDMTEKQIMEKPTDILAKAAFMWVKRGLAEDWTNLEKAVKVYDKATLKACRESK